MTGTSAEGERGVSLFALAFFHSWLKHPPKSNRERLRTSRQHPRHFHHERMRHTGFAPPHEGRDSTAFRIWVIVMLCYRKQTIQVYWLVVFWCCRQVQSPNGLRSRQKIEKRLNDPTPLTKQTNHGFQKSKKHPLDLPIQNGLYLERMNSLVCILSWCFLRSVSDNCRHFSVYRIKNCKHT